MSGPDMDVATAEQRRKHLIMELDRLQAACTDKRLPEPARKAAKQAVTAKQREIRGLNEMLKAVRTHQFRLDEGFTDYTTESLIILIQQITRELKTRLHLMEEPGQPGQSVHAASAGLPTLGKRH